MSFSDFYWQRVDRNLGIITVEEQERLRNCTVAIAGCGGMGGLIAMLCARIGVGRIKITDNQQFDASNLNRQFAAKLSSIGVNKAASTYKELKEIVGEDIQIDFYTSGIDSDSVEDFVKDADFIFDEIEFFQIRPRILLHQAARKFDKKILNCNVVGFGSRMFLFTPDSMTMESFLEMDLETTLSESVVRRLLQRLVPRLSKDFSEEVIEEWIFKQNKAPIFGGTPAISSGMVVSQFVLNFLGTNNRPWIHLVPPMPAYGYLDVGTFESGIFIGPWW
ncbi:MAG: Dinucleotide-utilizing enzyme for molybdopterin and thiamine biosynthesis [Candidatus Doudnabacteria bacterium]|nr:Dinucleotide-utilizing enzyme for molybdopterin and thiamine biosynthesis [Candidatus Doudnabacteria bacterium]